MFKYKNCSNYLIKFNYKNKILKVLPNKIIELSTPVYVNNLLLIPNDQNNMVYITQNTNIEDYYANQTSIISISGALQSQINDLKNSLMVSNVTGYNSSELLNSISGSLQTQISNIDINPTIKNSGNVVTTIPISSSTTVLFVNTTPYNKIMFLGITSTLSSSNMVGINLELYNDNPSISGSLLYNAQNIFSDDNVYYDYNTAYFPLTSSKLYLKIINDNITSPATITTNINYITLK